MFQRLTEILLKHLHCVVGLKQRGGRVFGNASQNFGLNLQSESALIEPSIAGGGATMYDNVDNKRPWRVRGFRDCRDEGIKSGQMLRAKVGLGLRKS